MRTFSSLERVDEWLENIFSEGLDDSKLREKLKEFSFLPGSFIESFLHASPYSNEYKLHMQQFHNAIINKSGRDYTIDNEGLPDLNVDWETLWGFPYGTQDYDTVGSFLIAYGFLIKTMELPKSSKILEIGCGLGSLTEFLVRMGYAVDAIDPNPVQCEIVRNKLSKYPTKANIVAESLDSFLEHTQKKYDAVIFFASFHHIFEHARLLEQLSTSYLTETGKIFLADEPIIADDDACLPTVLPYPWGCRLDGGSLRAMRLWGWVELGFRRSYLEALCDSLNLNINFHSLPVPHSHIYILSKKC